MQKLISLVILIIISASSLNGQTSDPLTGIDAYVTRVMQKFQVPGLSVAVVKDSKVVLVRGYGIRRLGDSAKVDAKTLFGIASNTKAFAATALALLVEEGKLNWDAPVIQYLPWFQMRDPYVTRELTVRDLLVHRSGLSLGAGDLLWWPPSTYTRSEIAERLRHIPLSTSFRSAYAYDNVLYLIAGKVTEALAGKTWDDFVKSRILDPVGMTGSNLLGPGPPAGENVAATHAIIDGRLQQVKPFYGDNANPAAGINSNAEDMAKWMIVQLDSGRLADGAQLFLPQTTKELWTMVTPIPTSRPPQELQPLHANFNGYALGFGVRDYRGKKTVSHTGGLPGYVSRLTMLPELKLGVVVLTNQESGAAFNAITYEILDRFLQTSAHDWLDAFAKAQARGDSAASASEHSALTTRDSSSKPSLSPEKYAGTYTDVWYGDVEISSSDGKLEIKFMHTPWLVGALEHWQHDTFIARWYDRELRADAYLTFALNPDATIDQLKMTAVSPTTDFSFDFHDLLLKPKSESKN